MTTTSGEDEAWRVLLLHGLETGAGASIRSFTLPDPRTGRAQGFLLANNELLEVNRFKQAFSTWLTGDRLIADGGLFLGTPYDPLFLLLPLLDRARDKDESCPAGKFKELDELLYDNSAPGFSEVLQSALRAAPLVAEAEASVQRAGVGVHGVPSGTAFRGDAGKASGAPPAEPSAGQPPTKDAAQATRVAAAAATDKAYLGAGAAAASRPPSCSTLRGLHEQLACICDVQRVDETCYYRLNDRRVLAWLLCKYRQMQAALAPQVAGMELAHAQSYVLSFLEEYVAERWTTQVAKHLGISEKPLPGTTTAAAAATTLQPTDANTLLRVQRTPPSALAGPPEKKQKVDPRPAAKQAALAKQAVGTKKLTSFFNKK